MGLRVNNNIAALNAYRNLSVTDGQMSKSLEKLSSGFRINRAADDAAGLAISEGLRSQIGGLKVAVRNTQDGISVVQTAEGALTETHSILQRMRDLSVQASNDGGMNADAKGNIQSELSQLKSELDRIANTTTFNGKKLLDGSFNAAFQVGSNSGETISFAVGSVGKGMNASGLGVSGVDVTAAAPRVRRPVWSRNADGRGQRLGRDHLHRCHRLQLGAPCERLHQAQRHHLLRWQELRPRFGGVRTPPTRPTPCALTRPERRRRGCVRSGQHGEPVRGGGTNTELVFTAPINTAGYTDAAGALSASAIDIAKATPAFAQATGASAAIDALDTAIKTVSTQRADLGAIQNRFDHTINNLNVAVENLTASESRIRDADMAQEMVQFTRNQILSQAGTAMLAQANQASQGVLSLLR